MKYYLDTEFIEYPNTIDLISIGIKCEDGRTFYAESNEFDITKANDWVIENVINKLIYYKLTDPITKIKPFINRDTKDNLTMFCNKKRISDMIKIFIGSDIPEFYGYYADYDWIVFCWLFGSMIDLPKGWPMYCKDLKQMLDVLKLDPIQQSTNEHNALVDAIWNEKLHKHIILCSIL